MKYGLIGNPLAHSWSPEIHQFLIGESYQLRPLKENELDDFFQERNFEGINVTIPYKKTVIPYLDFIDEAAQELGAVNTIVNRDGKLYGYNTDYLGFKYLLENNSIDVHNKTVAVLGTGGASKAIKYALNQLGCEPLLISRTHKESCITYDELYERASEIEIIVNTTPVGLYPNLEEAPIEIKKFPNLTAVVDIIANPLKTKLMLDAEEMGVKAIGGLEMLVAQAYYADLLFTNSMLEEQLINDCYNQLLFDKRNIVLIGMPTSGKTTVGKLLAQKTGKQFYDIDEEIKNSINMSIADYFAEYGEQAFRDLETSFVKKIENETGLVISTGGGIIKRAENINSLAHNGIIIWLDRDIELLSPASDRPLSSNIDDLHKLFEERKHLYQTYSDIVCKNNSTQENAVNLILRELKGEQV